MKALKFPNVKAVWNWWYKPIAMLVFQNSHCVKSVLYFFCSQGYDQKRKLFCTNSFVLAHSSAKKNLHWTTNGKVFNTVVSHDFNMTSFSPCCHNWLACICFCACICLLSRIFCLACYRLCVEQLLAFHSDIGDIV